MPNREMERQRGDVGARLRHARKVKELGLRELAERVGCSPSLLSRVETGRVNPSLNTLHQLVKELDISIGALFAETEGKTNAVWRRGRRPVIRVDALRQGEGITLERLIPYASDHLLQANIHIIAPGGGSEGAISHRGEELGYVLEGEVELTIGDQGYHLVTGDSFCFRSDLPHSYRNLGAGPARVLWVNTPPTF